MHLSRFQFWFPGCGNYLESWSKSPQTETKLKFTETILYHGYAFMKIFTMFLQCGNHLEMKYEVSAD